MQQDTFTTTKVFATLPIYRFGQTRRAAPNSSYKKLAVQYSADTFVVNQTLVLRINICGKNRQLLVAAKR
jgi:hypothetical protein